MKTAWPRAGFISLGLALAATACRPPADSVVPADHGTRWDIAMSPAMVFSPATFTCAPGAKVTVCVTNSMPASQADIAHTFVILAPGANTDEFGTEVISASPENNYIPEKFRSLVVASTPLVHPGKSVTMAFTAPARPGTYPVVCAFPGHCILGMRGQLVVR